MDSVTGASETHGRRLLRNEPALLTGTHERWSFELSRGGHTWSNVGRAAGTCPAALPGVTVNAQEVFRLPSETDSFLR